VAAVRRKGERREAAEEAGGGHPLAATPSGRPKNAGAAMPSSNVVVNASSHWSVSTTKTTLPGASTLWAIRRPNRACDHHPEQVCQSASVSEDDLARGPHDVDFVARLGTARPHTARSFVAVCDPEGELICALRQRRGRTLATSDSVLPAPLVSLHHDVVARHAAQEGGTEPARTTSWIED